MIRALTIDDAIHVARKLRPHDRAEVLATWAGSDVVDWARFTARLQSEHHFTAVAGDGEPVAIGGFFVIWPGLVQAWMVASDRLAEIGIELNYRVLEMHRDAVSDGVHRFQAHAMQGNAAGMRWLERLGYRRETTMRRFGRYGEDFELMARVEAAPCAR